MWDGCGVKRDGRRSKIERVYRGMYLVSCLSLYIRVHTDHSCESMVARVLTRRPTPGHAAEPQAQRPTRKGKRNQDRRARGPSDRNQNFKKTENENLA